MKTLTQEDMDHLIQTAVSATLKKEEDLPGEKRKLFIINIERDSNYSQLSLVATRQLLRYILAWHVARLLVELRCVKRFDQRIPNVRQLFGMAGNGNTSQREVMSEMLRTCGITVSILDNGKSQDAFLLDIRPEQLHAASVQVKVFLFDLERR